MTDRISLTVLLGLALFVAACSGSRNSADTSDATESSVVAVFADRPLTLDAFETIYARTAGGVDQARSDSLAAYQDFLERYVDFRLKVMAGEAAGYDQDSSIVSEINNYRLSFAKPFLLDKNVMNPIIQTMYERKKEMVDVSHILLRVKADAPPADTLQAFNAMVAIEDSLEQGMPFSEAAYRFSQDPSARQNPEGVGFEGRLGYVSSGLLVEPFESFAYRTPVGERSPIFRTQFGYHLLYVHDRKPTPAPLRLSHILIRPRSATAADSAAAMEQIADLQQRLAGGAKFEELAQEFSADRASSLDGGDLGFLEYVNKGVAPAFVDSAFAHEVGEVTGVVQTRWGLHLLKVTDRLPPQSFDEQYESLKQTAARLPRTKAAERALAADILQTHGARIDTTALVQFFEVVPSDSVYDVLKRGAFPSDQADRPIITLGDSTYSLRQLSAFSRKAQLKDLVEKREQLLSVAQSFLDEHALSYEAYVLEERDEEFRRIMEEFRDGLVLFRLMEDSVWTAASQDSAGMRAYFDAHRGDYRYPERMRIVSLSGPSDTLMDATLRRLRNGLTLGDLLREQSEDSTQWARVDTVRIAEPTGTVYDNALDLETGTYSQVLPNRVGYVVLYKDGVEAPRPMTYDEARTDVLSNYQALLEEHLIERLRSTYHAQTYPERLQNAFSASSSSGGETPATLE